MFAWFLVSVKPLHVYICLKHEPCGKIIALNSHAHVCPPSLLRLVSPLPYLSPVPLYLHSPQTLNELKILEVSLPDGAEACWVFLSCLEVLRTCERYSDSSEMETYSLQTASLWAYAREKLLHLGNLEWRK